MDFAWLPSGDGASSHPQCALKPHRQQTLNLYVQPEPSPELEEQAATREPRPSLQYPIRLAHDPASLAQPTSPISETHEDQSLDQTSFQPGSQSNECQLQPPCSSPSSATAAPSSSMPRLMAAVAFGDAAFAKVARSSSSPRQSATQLTGTAAEPSSPAAQHTSETLPHLRHRTFGNIATATASANTVNWIPEHPAAAANAATLGPRPLPTHGAAPNGAAHHQPQPHVTPAAASAPAQLPRGFCGTTDGLACDPMQTDCARGSVPSVANHMPAAELYRVHSLSLSGPDRDLLDTLLGGPEPGGASPALVTPSSFLATGPFADAALQPALSDYSDRASPAQLDAMLEDAEGASGMQLGGADGGPGVAAQEQEGHSHPHVPQSHLHPVQLPQHQALHHQPQLLNAYSEPLPFSAPLPHHLALHPNCPAGVAAAASAAAGKPPAAPAGHQAHPPHGQQQQQQQLPGAAGSNAQPWPAPYGHPGNGSSPQQQHHHHAEQQQHPQQQQRQGGTPHRLSRSMPTLDEHDLLPPAHSAPAPSMFARSPPAASLPPGGAGSSGGACSPMNVDADLGRSSSYSAGGGPAISAAGARHLCGPAISAGGGGSSGGAQQQQQQLLSAFDPRGKRLRQQAPDGAPASATHAAAPGAAVAHAVSAGAAGPTNGCTGPSSHSSHSHSVGEPMSVSATEGAYGHGTAAAYPPPYGMYPPPYGMGYEPYGYPPPGYPGYHHPSHYPYPDVPPPAGRDGMHAAGGYGPPPPHGMDASGAPRMPMHYPGFMVPRQRLYRRFVSGLQGRSRDGVYPSELVAPQPLQPGSATAVAVNGDAVCGLASMASAPTGSVVSGGGLRPTVSGKLTASAGGLPPTQAAASSFVAVGNDAPAAAARAASFGGTRSSLGAPTPAAAAAPSEMDSSQAARECHDMFSTDDVPLPLPPSTVAGIREELRAVTQELLQRRMETNAARGQQQQQAWAAAAGEVAQSMLQSANSGAFGETTSSMTVRSAPAGPPQQTLQHAMPTHSAAAGSSSMLPKRPPAGPTSSAGVSPVRARPVPSAPIAPQLLHLQQQHMAPMPATTAAAGLGGGGRSSGSAMSLPPMAPSDPCMLARPGQLGGPNAMRQLFPPSAGGAPGGLLQPSASHPAPGTAAGRLPLTVAPAATAPAGPRPAMSGKSAASATQSASMAHAAAMRTGQTHPHAHLQQQQWAGPAGPSGWAAEAEDDGEEVHGPPQRSSYSQRPSGGVPAPSTASGMPPPPPGYYGAPYDYPGYPSYGAYPGYPGYAPLPGPHGVYGSRPYGMYPGYGMPPSYRYGTAAYGAPAWAEYGMPPSSGPPAAGKPPPGYAMPPGSAGAGAYPMTGV